MHVLITGGAGFLGYHLGRYHVGRGDEVTLVDNFSKTGGAPDRPFQELAAHPRVHAVPVDLTRPLPDGNIPQAFGVVYHMAAINGTRFFYDMPYEVARVNVLSTIHLLDWLTTRSVGRLLYASTSEVYAGCERLGLLTLPTDEQVPVAFPQPTPTRFSYGTSKFMGEFLCQQFGVRQGIPTTIVRYHNLYGPRMGTEHVIPEFVARLGRNEQPFRIYGGEQTRSFCFVDDAVEATYRAATCQACAGEVLHIGNAAEEIRIEVLARLLMELMGRSVELLECGRRSHSVSRRCPDTSKLERLTGFTAQVALRDGLQRTIDWFQAHHLLPCP